MNYILFILFSISSLSFSAVYSVGDTISESDQSDAYSTCYEGNGYSVNDSWSLSDFNGALNGGNYNVIFLEMSATW